MSRFTQYLKDVKGEMKHVSWPTKRQATVFTILVIFISLLTAAYLGFFDFILTSLLDAFVI